MGPKSRVSWLILLWWVLLSLCLKAQSDVSVKFLQAPLALSSSDRATFSFEGVVVEDGRSCRNCTFKCKLDEQRSSKCDARQVSYADLRSGGHTFEVCVNGSQGASCAGYNWTVDITAPTAWISAEQSFTNALNVSVNISFTEPCIGGGGFRCSSVTSCNLLVYGAGQVIPSTLTTVEPNLKFSVLVALSAQVEYGRVVLAMAKGFCTDAAGNRFMRTTNSSFLVRFDRRKVYLSLRTHIPEKLLQLNSVTRTVVATNNIMDLKIYLYFSEPVLNSSAEIQNALHTNNGFLVPTNRKTLGSRRFGYLIQNVSTVAVVTVSVYTGSIISRQGTPVLQADPVTFLYDSQRPSARLSTTSGMRTRDHTVPVLIKFTKPVFGFESSTLSISGGYLKSFRQLSRSIYTIDVQADDDIVSVNIPENVTGDVAGNMNIASNLLQVKHYLVPRVSILLYVIVTAAFGITATAAGFLTISTASLQSLGTLARPSSLLTTEPTRNLFRIACHVQVFALSKWLATRIPLEYYEFTRGLEWIIPRIGLPWDSGNIHSIMVESEPPVTMRTEESKVKVPGVNNITQVRKNKVEADAAIFGLPLTPMEYNSFFESQRTRPEADSIFESQGSNGWREFNKNLFWLALIGGGFLLLHLLVLAILKFRKKRSNKQKNYGALLVPRFEIFLIILALPCLCQAAASVIRGGSTSGIVVGILVLGVIAFLLLSLLSFLSVGITLGRLLQYKELHQVEQQFHWYQELVRVTLGPGKKGQWTWRNQPNSVHLTKLGPLFEDLRGPPKYMLSQITDGTPVKRGDRIIASDDEREDTEAPFIQKLFGILRIYYILLESVRRVALGIVAGAYLDSETPRFPALVVLCITAFQLFFLVLKKPFIKKKVQLVEIISLTMELGVFALCLTLVDKQFSMEGEKRTGVLMLLLFMIAFVAQMVNEWYALYKQVLLLSPVENSFSSGLKTACIGFLLLLIPERLLKNWDQNFPSSTGGNETDPSSDQNRTPGSRSSGTEKPWMKQLRELAKSSFSKGGGGGVSDPSSSRSRFWSGKRSGSSSMTSSADSKSKPQELYKGMEEIFSSS